MNSRSAAVKTKKFPSPFTANRKGIREDPRPTAVPYRTSRTGSLRWLLASIDVVLVLLDGAFAYYLRFAHHPLGNILRNGREHIKDPSQHQHVAFLLLYAVLIVLVCISRDLYRVVSLQSRLDEGYTVAKAVTLATLALTVFIYLAQAKEISRLVLGICAVFNVVTLISWRMLRRHYVSHRLKQGHGVRNAIIVGASEAGHALARTLDRNPSLGWTVRGFLDQAGLDNPRCLGSITEFQNICRRHFIEDVFITEPIGRDVVKELVAQARTHRLNVHVIPDLYDGLCWGASLSHIGGLPVLALHEEPISTKWLLIKRLMDVALSTGVLVLLSPYCQ